jgi:hypothetical protein
MTKWDNVGPADPHNADIAVAALATEELLRAEEDIRRLLRDVLGYAEVDISAPCATGLRPQDWDALIARAPNPRHDRYHNLRAPGGRFIRAREG